MERDRGTRDGHCSSSQNTAAAAAAVGSARTAAAAAAAATGKEMRRRRRRIAEDNTGDSKGTKAHHTRPRTRLVTTFATWKP